MFDWADYLILAERLAGATSDEAALRSAVSRAYYAAFCKARGRLRREGVIVPKFKTHQFVWDNYTGARDLQRRRIGEEGERLKRFREKADYDDSLPELGPIVNDCIPRAKDLLAALGRLP